MRRERRPSLQVVEHGTLLNVIAGFQVTGPFWDGTNVYLTRKEYQILELLCLRKGMTLTKEMILNHLYSGSDGPEIKIIDVFLCNLRKKLANASGGKNYFETVWGRGYVLREPAHEEEREKHGHLAAAPCFEDLRFTTVTLNE